MKRKPDRKVVTKSELTEQLGDKQKHLPKRIVEYAVNNILEHLGGALSKGDRIEIRRFGSFSLRQRKPHMVRNPRTGETAFTGHRSIPCFKPGKLLRDRANSRSGSPRTDIK